MTKIELKIGDTVLLKSGSTRMTVIGLVNEFVRLEWFKSSERKETMVLQTAVRLADKMK